MNKQLKVRDVFVVRQYYYKGINVLVEIDFSKKKVSLVEIDTGNGRIKYKPKQWLFADRELKYMQGWINILEAMQLAVKSAQEELEAVKDSEFKALVKSLVEATL